ncbi:unnamed protein product [Taenia asiatica]|uniref:Uncharacterized protein n=1 Tax=Taenia asiatica TaxID=60517 RepID=A0A0R3WAG5_TAEAS|nr:unnamed protein product [Taenia asiatica]
MIDGSRQPIGARDYVETRCMCVWAYTYTRRRDNAREGVERTGCCCGDQLKKQESSSEELPSHSLDLFYFLCPTPPLIRGDLLIQTVKYFLVVISFMLMGCVLVLASGRVRDLRRLDLQHG